MDLKPLREQAIEATAQFFWDKLGFVPDEDSEEWEAEYRRQFALARERPGTAPPVAAGPVAAMPQDPPGWAQLSGAPTQIRWAASLRADRLKEIGDRDTFDWLATTWTKAKSWIDTRDLPTQIFLERIRPRYAEYRKLADERARVLGAARREKASVADDLHRQIEAAGITVDGLIELVDIAERLPALPIKGKLAELDSDTRTLRVFETSDTAVLMVLEKGENGRTEYGIERDAGLVSDLVLFARSLELR